MDLNFYSELSDGCPQTVDAEFLDNQAYGGYSVENKVRDVARRSSWYKMKHGCVEFPTSVSVRRWQRQLPRDQRRRTPVLVFCGELAVLPMGPSHVASLPLNFVFVASLVVDISHAQSGRRGIWAASDLPGPRPDPEHQRRGFPFRVDRRNRWQRRSLELPEPEKQPGGGGQRPFLRVHLCQFVVSWLGAPRDDRPGWRWSPVELLCFSKCLWDDFVSLWPQFWLLGGGGCGNDKMLTTVRQLCLWFTRCCWTNL